MDCDLERKKGIRIRAIDKRSGECHDFVSCVECGEFLGYTSNAIKNEMRRGHLTNKSGFNNWILLKLDDKDFEMKNRKALDEIKQKTKKDKAIL